MESKAFNIIMDIFEFNLGFKLDLRDHGSSLTPLYRPFNFPLSLASLTHSLSPSLSLTLFLALPPAMSLNLSTLSSVSKALLHPYFFTDPLPAHHSELPIPQRGGKHSRQRLQPPVEFTVDLPLQESLVDPSLIQGHAWCL